MFFWVFSTLGHSRELIVEDRCLEAGAFFLMFLHLGPFWRANCREQVLRSQCFLRCFVKSLEENRARGQISSTLKSAEALWDTPRFPQTPLGGNTKRTLGPRLDREPTVEDRCLEASSFCFHFLHIGPLWRANRRGQVLRSRCAFPYASSLGATLESRLSRTGA